MTICFDTHDRVSARKTIVSHHRQGPVITRGTEGEIIYLNANMAVVQFDTLEQEVIVPLCYLDFVQAGQPQEVVYHAAIYAQR